LIKVVTKIKERRAKKTPDWIVSLAKVTSSIFGGISAFDIMKAPSDYVGYIFLVLAVVSMWAKDLFVEDED